MVREFLSTFKHARFQKSTNHVTHSQGGLVLIALFWGDSERTEGVSALKN